MHGLDDFLQNLTIVLATAAVVAVLFQKLRQPVVLGYILAGLIIGPYVPIPLVADRGTVRALSEIGVIFLMFSLGLEFSIRKLIKVLPTAGVIVVIECALMLWFGYMAGRTLGWTALESIYAGAIVAISSTTIIIKAFAEDRIRGPLSRIVFAILIAEDLIAILLLAVLPLASGPQTGTGWAMAEAAGTLFMFLLTVIVGGALLIPRLMHVVLRLHRPELTLLACVGVALGVSLLAKMMGYSVALGAFLAGSLMAEASDEAYLDALIRPLRDIFAAIFFVSVGMMIDPALIVTYWPVILLFTAIVMIGKFSSVTVATFLTGSQSRLAIQTGMSLAQIGEFSFIIAGIGIASGAIGDFLLPIAVSVSALTTLTTPCLIRGSDPVAGWVDTHLPQPIQTFTQLYTGWIQKVRATPGPQLRRSRVKRLIRMIVIDTLIFATIIIGAALSIDVLADRLIVWLGIPAGLARSVGIAGAAALSLPFCIGIIRCAHSLGLNLATQALPAQESGQVDLAATPRRVLVVSLQLLIVLAVGVPLLALTQPFLPSWHGAAVLAVILGILGIGFWRSTTHLQGHVRAGAEIVIEALNTTLDQHREPSILDLERYLPGLGTVTMIRLTDKSPVVGRTLTELNLRGRTGASVLAILHGKASAVVPTGAEQLRAGDVLAITGTFDAVRACKELLFAPLGHARGGDTAGGHKEPA